MISKYIKQTSTIYKSLTKKSSYHFVAFPTKRDKRYVQYKYYERYTEDDLRFHHQSEDINGGIQGVVDYFKGSTDRFMKPIAMATLIYNMGLKDIKEPLIIEEIERQLIHHKGRFLSRWAFGCLYGLYRTSTGTNKAIPFFEEELFPKINSLQPYEAMELIQALSYNEVFSDERKHELIKTYFQPIIVNNFKSHFKYEAKLMMILFDSLYKMKYYDQEIWDPLLDSLTKRKSVNKFDYVRPLYEKLYKLNQSGEFYRDITPEIEHFVKILSRTDNQWRYNLQEMRLYSYEELKAKREDYPYPNQVIRRKSIDVKFEEEPEEVVEKVEIREKEFSKLIKEKYIAAMRGDFTGLKELDADILGDEKDAEDQIELVSEEPEYEDIRTNEQQKMRKKKASNVKLATKVDKIMDIRDQLDQKDLQEIDINKLFMAKKKKGPKLG